MEKKIIEMNYAAVSSYKPDASSHINLWLG